jgi:hypothetical protein
MKKNKFDLTIIVCAYKNVNVLKLCLKALKEKISSRLKCEIIVVDIDAIEPIRDLVLDEFPEFIYFPIDKNLGFAKSLNRGIKKSKADIILSLNPDIVIKKNAVEKMYDYVKDHPQVGLAGPKLLNFNGTKQDSCFTFYTPYTILYRRTFLGKTGFGKKALREFVINLDNKKPTSFKGWLMGSALMLRRDNLEKVGPMDERYFMYFEDVDWCRRFYEQGYDIVYIPTSEMFHYHGKMSASKSFWNLIFNKMAYIHFLSSIKYFLKFKSWKVERKT